MMFMIVHAATPCFHVSKLVMCGKQMQFAFNCVQMSPVCFVSNRVSLKERSCHVLLVQFWGSSISVAFCRSIWKCHTWHDDPEDATHLNHILGYTHTLRYVSSCFFVCRKTMKHTMRHGATVATMHQTARTASSQSTAPAASFGSNLGDFVKWNGNWRNRRNPICLKRS